MSTETFFAHSRSGEPEGSWEPLLDHLVRVGEMARQFASAFDSGEWGYLAGLWHDLGKYRPEFQRRLRGDRLQVEHAGAGAALAVRLGIHPLSFVIAGHHGGLANRIGHAGHLTPLAERIPRQLPILQDIWPLLPASVTSHPCPEAPSFLRKLERTPKATRAQELWIRFLFSALVDADRLATESFYQGDVRAPIREFDSIAALGNRLEECLRKFTCDTPVNQLRADVLALCGAAAERRPGLFSLTVPTGGGKTLSSLAFALAHARKWGLRRVIVVIPYTSIIEQTARVFKTALGSRNVVEHHSALDELHVSEESGENETRRCLATENWDAPLIVTTSVQFFETLFSNNPSRCRKLHRVARSVVVVDEAQTLPTRFLLCLLDGMRELTRSYGCSLVLSTATQPALVRRDALPEGLEDVHEIIQDRDGLGQLLDRVELRWPAPDEPPMPYTELAAELAGHDRVLAIVHRRGDARQLAQLLPPEGCFHLSALMCATHRAEVLERIRRTLRDGGPCRVVATQLVEAGVDIDFPVVYRAMAGLDSIAQAAGRCNREGSLTDQYGRPRRGNMRVFRAETLPPRGTLRIGFEKTEEMLARYGPGLNFVEGRFIEEYFRALFHADHLDAKNVMLHREQLDFESVGRLVKLVDDGFSVPVVVPWRDAATRVAKMIERPHREALRAIQPYVVQVRERDLGLLQRLGAVAPIEEFGFQLVAPYLHLYDEATGLVVEEDAEPDAGALVV